MFIKITWPNRTILLECNKAQMKNIKDNRMALSIDQEVDGMILDRADSSEVFFMNDQGKTIDRWSFGPDCIPAIGNKSISKS